MHRAECHMYEIHGGTVYCGYYDVFFMKCNDVTIGQCPEGLDDEPDDEDDEISINDFPI